MTKNRTRLLITLRTALALTAALRAGMISDHHHMPLLLTICLCASLAVVLDQSLTGLIYRKRTVACPAGCGVTIAATREDAARQQALLQQHQRTAHTATADDAAH